MLKQSLVLSTIAASILSTQLYANDALLERFEKMEQEMAKLKQELNALKSENTKLATELSKQPQSSTPNEKIDDLQSQIDTLTKKTTNDNLKWGVDFRTSLDNIRYKMADGSTQKNNALFSNRLWLNMSYAATKELSFTGQLAYNKIYGQRAMSPNAMGDFEGFDWITNEAAYDNTLRVRSAYFFYNSDDFFGADVPWTVSIGRRPSTEGHLINLRDDVDASSPLAHTVNVEFDGASAKFGLEDIIKLDGSYIKFCAGRGMSEAEPRFSSAPYASKDSATSTIDMGGIIFVPYDDKQYSIGTQYTYAKNLIDTATSPFLPNGNINTAHKSDFAKVGGLHTATAFVMANGIGDEINDFLDDTTLFASVAMSKTDPYANKSMLGSDDSKTGYSFWIGAQFPSLISDNGRWGIEYNHGSKYWRPITYGEDTMIGSKIATRGDAYEVYFTEPIINKYLSFQLRYTYLNYKYTGSNGFFGSNTGTPMLISDIPAGTDMAKNVVDKAQDIRAYLRYKF